MQIGEIKEIINQYSDLCVDTDTDLIVMDYEKSLSKGYQFSDFKFYLDAVNKTQKSDSHKIILIKVNGGGDVDELFPISARCISFPNFEKVKSFLNLKL